MPDFIEKLYGFHVYFWSYEGEPLEPIHFHISHTPHPNATKIWIKRDGTLEVAYDSGELKSNELKRILNYMSDESEFKNAKKKWFEHFGEISFFN